MSELPEVYSAGRPRGGSASADTGQDSRLKPMRCPECRGAVRTPRVSTFLDPAIVLNKSKSQREFGPPFYLIGAIYRDCGRCGWCDLLAPVPESDWLDATLKRTGRHTFVRSGESWKVSITDGISASSVLGRDQVVTCPDGRWAARCDSAIARKGRLKLVLRVDAAAAKHKVIVTVRISPVFSSECAMLINRALGGDDWRDLPHAVIRDMEATCNTLNGRNFWVYVARAKQGHMLLDIEPVSRTNPEALPV